VALHRAHGELRKVIAAQGSSGSSCRVMGQFEMRDGETSGGTNREADMWNSRLNKHFLMLIVFVALWGLWMIGLIPDATPVLH
jgi:hypothetical protein